MNEDLKQSFQQIVSDFGQDVINDKNLANIVADYYSFDRNPAVRNILKAIVSDGYATKISLLKASKGDPSIDLERYANEIEQSWGYAKEQTIYVISCIANVIGIDTSLLKKPSIKQPNPKTDNNNNIKINNQPSNKTDQSHRNNQKIKPQLSKGSFLTSYALFEISLFALIFFLFFVISYDNYHSSSSVLILVIISAFTFFVSIGYGIYLIKKGVFILDIKSDYKLEFLLITTGVPAFFVIVVLLEGLYNMGIGDFIFGIIAMLFIAILWWFNIYAYDSSLKWFNIYAYDSSLNYKEVLYSCIYSCIPTVFIFFFFL